MAACRPTARTTQPTEWASPIQTAPNARPMTIVGALGPVRRRRSLAVARVFVARPRVVAAARVGAVERRRLA